MRYVERFAGRGCGEYCEKLRGPAVQGLGCYETFGCWGWVLIYDDDDVFDLDSDDMGYGRNGGLTRV